MSRIRFSRSIKVNMSSLGTDLSYRGKDDFSIDPSSLLVSLCRTHLRNCSRQLGEELSEAC